MIIYYNNIVITRDHNEKKKLIIYELIKITWVKVQRKIIKWRMFKITKKIRILATLLIDSYCKIIIILFLKIILEILNF